MAATTTTTSSGSSIGSIEPLDDKNYATWKLRMHWSLVTKGLWEAVEGTESAKEKDARARAQIGLNVTADYQDVVAEATTAKDAWEKLEQLYNARSTASLLLLKRQMHSLEKRPNESLMQYIARAKGIRNQLKAAGHDVDNEDVLVSVLAGLPDQYTPMAMFIRGTQRDMSLDDALAKLMLADKESMPNLYPTEKIEAYTATTARTCWYCGKAGHMKRNCPKRRNEEAKLGRSAVITL